MAIISTTYSELNQLKYSKSIITIGSFDGVHLGHQKIFDKMNKLSLENNNCKKILITFDPHPASIINKKILEQYYLSSSLFDKVNSIQKNNIDIIVVISFNKKLSLVTAKDFFEKIISSFNPLHVVMGYDHGFGYKREGNVKFLKTNYKESKFQIHEIKPKKLNKETTISSTLIRKLILNGEIRKANLMLNKKYSLIGTVVRGMGLGKKINFPTINLSVYNKGQILPKRGVYFVELVIENKKYKGMCNIGFRPTVTNSEEETIEIHIFRVKINADFYNKEVKVFFVEYIREEKKFKNIDFLIKQLNKDKQLCLSIKN